MTIFFEIVKDFLQKEIGELTALSHGWDTSLTNAVSNLVGLGRNPELAEQKRLLARKFMEEVFALKGNDEHIKSEIYKIIEKYDAESFDKSRTEGCQQGHFGGLMSKFRESIPKIYLALQRTNLLNVRVENDQPFYWFRYHMAAYFVQHMQSVEGVFTENVTLSERKKEVILTILEETKKETEKALLAPDFQGNVKKLVLKKLEDLKVKNEELVRANLTIAQRAKTYVGSFFGNSDPDMGTLPTYVDQAIEKIDPGHVLVKTSSDLAPADDGFQPS